MAAIEAAVALFAAIFVALSVLPLLSPPLALSVIQDLMDGVEPSPASAVDSPAVDDEDEDGAAPKSAAT